ncbi:MAG: aminodeoxychorismate lyase [Gammaproteobacteria bacterium]|nr:aminodeoxychorismate lyase [Gammaproteobacteria bacterium]
MNGPQSMLINGETADAVTACDRGLHYGDGVFETIAVKHGNMPFLNRHLSRLQAGCERLMIKPVDWDALAGEIKLLASEEEDCVIKSIITRGPGGRGYRPPEDAQPSRIVARYPWRDIPQEWYREGVKLRFCNTQLARNPLLAGVKHLNRLEQIMARAEWSGDSYHEGIMCDESGNVIECTMTNIFFVNNNQLMTPDLSRAGVAGIMRDVILGLAAKLDITHSVVSFTREQLLEATELFVCNSVIGVWPVKAIEDQIFNIGPVTRRLQEEVTAIWNASA